MNNDKRIAEAELFKPAIKIISQHPNGITTTKLIKELDKEMKPQGRDLFILKGRNDARFTQKVRNLISHRYNRTSIIYNGYVQY